MKRNICSLVLGIVTFAATSLSAQTFTVLHNFNLYSLAGGLGGEGGHPAGGLTLSNDVLYGTTLMGTNGSTVFKLNVNGSDFTQLAYFDVTAFHTQYPYGELIFSSSGNILYGTTQSGDFGGYFDWGDIFQVNTNGSGLDMIHSMDAGLNDTNTDGAFPVATLVISNDTLWGTAPYGGTNGDGTIFRVNTSGSNFMVLHTFTGGGGHDGGREINASDGAWPLGGLTMVSNVLYGTTSGGGTGIGTVFKINPDGTGFAIIHNFEDWRFGQGPEVGLVASGNTLYGVAIGGTNNTDTIYKINTDGSGFTVLHFFAAYPSDITIANDDGYGVNQLCLVGGMLYGTARSGGTNGYGTVFQLNTYDSYGSNFMVLHHFTEPIQDDYLWDTYDSGVDTNYDGASPQCALIVSSNTLYGTTSAGGRNGGGTVYSIQLPTNAPSLIMLGTDQTNYTFQSGSVATYYITNSFSIFCTTTIEGGAIIKYAPGTSITVEDLDCETSSNTPAIFTARDDDTVGIILSDSTHSPSGSYGSLEIIGVTGSVHDIQFYYVDDAIDFYSDDPDGNGLTYTLWNIGVSNCFNAFSCNDGGGGANVLNMTNLTVVNCSGEIDGDYMTAGTAVNSTFKNVGSLVNDDDGYGYYDFIFSYCTFSNVSFGGDNMYIDGDHNGFHSCSSPGYFGSDWYYY